MKHLKMTSKEYGDRMKGIIREILDLQELDEIQNWFTGLSRAILFGRNYSPSNLLMVLDQKNSALWTEGAKAWNRVHCFWNPRSFIYVFAPTAFGLRCDNCKRVNYQKKDLRNCKFCGEALGTNKAPLGFKLIPVFDIEDVDVTEKAEKTKKLQLIRRLQDKRRESVVQYRTDEGELSPDRLSAYAAALIQHIERKNVRVTAKRLNGAGARCKPGEIEYDEALVMGDNLGVLTHEWGHLMYHYGPDRKTLEKDQKELEAEMFSALVLSGVGADIKSKAAYLLSWSRKADKETREAKFIKAFHRIYHEAADTLKDIVSIVDAEMAEIYEAVDELVEEEKTQKRGEKTDSIPETVPVKKKEEDHHIQSVTVKRPGRLGTSTSTTLEGVSRTLARDSAKFPGKQVALTVNLAGGAFLNGYMLLDPGLISGRLNAGTLFPGAYPLPKTTPTLLLPAPESDIKTHKGKKVVSNTAATEKESRPPKKEKTYLSEISLKIGEFRCAVDSFAEADGVLKQLALNRPSDINIPKVRYTLVFDDDFEYQGSFRLAKNSEGVSLKNEVSRRGEFLAGTRPGILSEEAYKETLSGVSDDEKQLAIDLLSEHHLDDYQEVPTQIKLFDAMFGDKYNPPAEERLILSDFDFKCAFGDKKPSRKKAPPILVDGDGVDDSILGIVSEDRVEITTIADACGVDVFESDCFTDPADGPESLDDLYDGQGNPVELRF